jgi:hypothetical protein
MVILRYAVLYFCAVLSSVVLVGHKLCPRSWMLVVARNEAVRWLVSGSGVY